MPIIATPTAIPDVLLIEPKVYGDDRGWFYESFNQQEFSAVIGQTINFVQDNHSLSKRGVLRGMHYQLERTQGKLVRVCQGSVFDVVVDIRQASPTFGDWVGVELSQENKKQLWIPPGFAHGFLVLSEEAQFLYKTTDYWHPSSERCLMWDDPTVGIQWPTIVGSPQLNPKDAMGLSWDLLPKL